MRGFRSVSLVEQVAGHLRREFLQGSFGTKAPGVHRLAAELGVHHTTAEEALQMLEKEGLLVGQGAGRSRRIRIPEHFTPPSMRVGILPYEETDRTLHSLLEMQHNLQDTGHTAGFTSMTLVDLGMDVKRVARFVKDSNVDAWVIVAGSREVLEWFADQEIPVFALCGRRRDVPIAGIGPDKLPALIDAVDRLVALGHRRIVLLLREEHRKPQPAFVVQAMLDRMESHGLRTGAYNLPDWENNPAGLRRCLDSLFLSTPPSALIADESILFIMTQHHLARKGILAPQQVSLICADPDPTFHWFSPSVAHILWDSRKQGRRIVGWANNVARGKDDRRQSLIKAEFVEGGTIGRAPGMGR